MAPFDTYDRVWQHSGQRGLKKLLMLALAKRYLCGLHGLTC